jgi:hypothetical protein
MNDDNSTKKKHDAGADNLKYLGVSKLDYSLGPNESSGKR